MEDDSHINMQMEVERAAEVLRAGGVILYPTDTVWGIGCDATNARAVEKVYKIKRRNAVSSLIVLVGEADELPKYADPIPDVVHDMMEGIKDPLTIIYNKGKNLAKSVLANDGSVAIRVAKDDFCKALIRRFGKPITSSSANITGEPNPLSFGKISEQILHEVDYVVNHRQKGFGSVKQSTIIRVSANGEIEIVRS